MHRINSASCIFSKLRPAVNAPQTVLTGRGGRQGRSRLWVALPSYRGQMLVVELVLVSNRRKMREAREVSKVSQRVWDW